MSRAPKFIPFPLPFSREFHDHLLEKFEITKLVDAVTINNVCTHVRNISHYLHFSKMCHLFLGRVISCIVSDDLADLNASVRRSDE